MGNVSKGYIQLTNYINKVVGWLLFIMLAVMSILIFWQVFARFVVGNSLTFSEEASRFLMIWLTLLGAGYAIKEGSLIAIDIVQNKLSGLSGKILKSLMSIIACSFYIVLIVYGFSMSQAISFQVAPTTGISMFWPMLALPVGGALMLLNTIAALIESLSRGGETA
jgi:TRAP-type transport system small permease protein